MNWNGTSSTQHRDERKKEESLRVERFASSIRLTAQQQKISVYAHFDPRFVIPCAYNSIAAALKLRKKLASKPMIVGRGNKK